MCLLQASVDHDAGMAIFIVFMRMRCSLVEEGKEISLKDKVGIGEELWIFLVRWQYYSFIRRKN